MTVLARFFVLVLLLAAPVSAAQARDVTAEEKQKLEATIASFDKAMRNEDYESITDTIPPRVLEFIAKQANVDVDTLRGVVIQQTKAALGSVKLEDFGMDTAATKFETLSNGEPFALIPTKTVMNSEETGKIVAKADTLAVLDGGNWYMVRVSEVQQLAILRKAYPEFASVEFSNSTMEAVE
ncbi:hypothetical protein AAIB41_06995 [Brucella sp. BE17]|uniref:hypothetical protein n=1 Tax=Brucella sp. BE17 TaxID=3142977 RepID=UPI0031BA5672